MGNSGALTGRRFFYGNWILLAAFYFAFIAMGCGFYAFSLFVVPMEKDLGWDRGRIMLALTLSFLFTGVTGPFVGRIVDRYGPRRVIAAGGLIGALGYVLSGLAVQLWHFYGSFIVNGIAMAMVGLVPTTTVISNWFKKRRGMAIGIMSAGIGAGGLILSPVLGGLIIPRFGWRFAFFVLACFVAGVIPLALLIVKTKPADMGLYPDGARNASEAAAAETERLALSGWTLREAVSTPTFWLIALSFFTFSVAEVGVLQSEVPYLQGIGFSAGMAAGLHGMVGLWSTIGKFFFGWLCDKIQPRFACAIGTAFQIVGTLLLMNIGLHSPAAYLWIYVIVMGLGVGNWLPTYSMMVSTNFGLLAYGSIFGVIGLGQSLGGSIAPFFTGTMYNAMGSYDVVFVVLAISYAVSLLSALLVARPKVSSGPAAR